MRIGILTFHRSINYGAYMQAFSLSHALQVRFPKHTVEIIDYHSAAMEKNYRVKFTRTMLRLPKEYFNKIARKKAFLKALRYLPLSDKTIITDDCALVYPYIKERYDIVIVGSDAVWNFIKRGFPNPYLLHTDGIIKLSYAASASGMPMSYMNDDRRRVLGEALSDYRFISVRDSYTKELVRACNAKVSVSEICDPTAFLDLSYVEATLGTTKENFKKEFYRKHHLDEEIGLIGVMGTDYRLIRMIRNRYRKTHRIVSFFGMTGEEDIHLPSVDPLSWSLLFSMFDLTVSSFFHGVMLSLRNGTPCIAIDLSQFGKSNVNKIEDVMGKMDLSDCFFKSEEAMYGNWESVLQKADALLQDKSIHPKIENNLLALAASANPFFQTLAELLEESTPLFPSVQRIVSEKTFHPNPTYPCTGCTLCVEKCPQGALEMVEENGFFVPKADEKKCISCGICKQVCPLSVTPENKAVLQCYAAAAKDAEMLYRSSSGGVMGILSEWIIENGGAVFGAAYDENMHLTHQKSDTPDGLRAFHGSKYLQSDMRGIFGKIEAELKAGKKVLFTGTPCQVAAVKKCFGEKYPTLYLADFICSGVQSPVLFDGYVRWLEKKYKKNVANLSFRDKRNGWQNKTICVTFDDGSEITLPAQKSSYYEMFYCMRNSCYNCRYRNGNNNADITVGDFWRIESLTSDFSTEKGVSAVLLRTEKGKAIWEANREKFSALECSYADIQKRQKKLTVSEQKPRYRNAVMKAASEKGYPAAKKVYRQRTMLYRYKKIILKKK